MDPEDVIRSLFGQDGLGVLPDTNCCAIERGSGTRRLRKECEAALARSPAGAGVTVILIADETGAARLGRWLWLPLQIAAATRAIGRSHGTVLGLYAVTPDLDRRALVYQLRSPAQRYAETFLISGPPRRGVAHGIRRGLSLWAGCDPAAGAIVLVGEKR